MLSWIRTRVCGPAQSQLMDTALEKPKLSRQELTDLFAKELGRPMLSKQIHLACNKPRHFGANRSFQVFMAQWFGLHAHQRGGSAPTQAYRTALYERRL